jgi:hypothetical protein
VLIRSLGKVAGETESEGERWKVKLIVFVGGTCGLVHVQSFNDNLKELGVVESKRGAIRKGLVHELLYAQDTVLCSYFAQREGDSDFLGIWPRGAPLFGRNVQQVTLLNICSLETYWT